ncbi:hypothetical protein MRB53_041082 [Persea americana]|nr:hypothetical protein MRB53_041082 [Persea americana]
MTQAYTNILAVTAILLQTISSALLLAISVELYDQHKSAEGLSIAALIFTSIALFTICCVVLYDRRSTYRASNLSSGRLLIQLKGLVALAAALITLASLIWTETQCLHGTEKPVTATTASLVYAEFVFWALASLSTILLWIRMSAARQNARASRPAHAKRPSTSTTLQSRSTPQKSKFYDPESQDSSPKSFTTYTDSNSPPSSPPQPQQTLAEQTSMTQLLPRRSSMNSFATAHTVPSPTSSAPSSRPTTPYQRRPPPTNLETIPGSRPASVALALDGPFPEEDLEDDHERREHEQADDRQPRALHNMHSFSAMSTSSLDDAPTSYATYRNRFRRPSMPSRPGSAQGQHASATTSPNLTSGMSPNPSTSLFPLNTAALSGGPLAGEDAETGTAKPEHDQSHIHPLFRTDSPLPPPTPSDGTIVMASAFAGQMLPLRSLSRASSRTKMREAQDSELAVTGGAESPRVPLSPGVAASPGVGGSASAMAGEGFPFVEEVWREREPKKDG